MLWIIYEELPMLTGLHVHCIGAGWRWWTVWEDCTKEQIFRKGKHIICLRYDHINKTKG